MNWEDDVQTAVSNAHFNGATLESLREIFENCVDLFYDKEERIED